MANKKNPLQRRSLSSRIDAAIADNENTKIAGITQEPAPVPAPPAAAPDGGAVVDTAAVTSASLHGTEPLRTKKATTIMPKEVFNVLQRYCTETETPKHRAIYIFILDGLHAAKVITEEDYQRFRDMAVLLTTTYAKKDNP